MLNKNELIEEKIKFYKIILLYVLKQILRFVGRYKLIPNNEIKNLEFDTRELELPYNLSLSNYDNYKNVNENKTSKIYVPDSNKFHETEKNEESHENEKIKNLIKIKKMKYLNQKLK